MAEHHDEHVISYKTYIWTWGWLLVLTALALGLGYAPINERLKALLLVGTTLFKILVIAAVFMHLRHERLNLVLITFAPLVIESLPKAKLRMRVQVNTPCYQFLINLQPVLPLQTIHQLS